MSYTLASVSTPDPNGGIGTTESYNHDFTLDALLGLEMRYFFSDEGKYGISTELLTTFNGGYGFNLGFIWRKVL